MANSAQQLFPLLQRSVVKVSYSLQDVVTGFLVCAKPGIVMSVAHAIPPHVDGRPVNPTITFFGEEATYPGEIWVLDRMKDYALIVCMNQDRRTANFLDREVLTFAPPDTVLAPCEPIWSISHPMYRDWRGNTGIIAGFFNNRDENFERGMSMFDHDIPLIGGSSGAPIFNNEGIVIGMQLWELASNYYPLCTGLEDSTRPFNPNTATYQRLRIQHSALKQAVRISYLDPHIRNKLRTEPERENPNLNLHLRSKYVQSKTREWRDFSSN